MGSFPETYNDLKLVMLYCHTIYIYIFWGGWGPKGLGKGWVVVVENNDNHLVSKGY